jgi:hypothetical protein
MLQAISLPSLQCVRDLFFGEGLLTTASLDGLMRYRSVVKHSLTALSGLMLTGNNLSHN